jgi:STE24 endopeptidase
MLHVLIILALALARLPDVIGDVTWHRPLHTWPWLPLPATIILCSWFHLIAWQAARGLRQPGGARRLQSMYHCLDITRWTSLAIVVAGVFACGWDVWVRQWLGSAVLIDELVIASPVLCTLIMTWWSVAPVERVLHEATLIRRLDEGAVIAPLPTRMQSVWQHVRFTMLLVLVPISLMIAWHDIMLPAPRWLGESGEWFTRNAAWLSWAGIAVILLITPFIMRLVWDTIALPAGELRDRIRAICDAYRIRVTGPLVWRTHGSMVNGAILGLFWPARYLLLTDALLERMQPASLDAIVAHEVAHVRMRHMIWLGVVVTAAALSAGWLIEAVFHLLPQEHDATWLIVSATPIAFIVALAAFVVTSQRFEWQADAFSVRHLARASGQSSIDEASALTVIATLGEVARANGMSIDRISLRHGSIATRQRNVRSLVGVPLDQLPIDRVARNIKVIAAVALAAGVAGLYLAA